ncbi:hypothetical protein [Vibrio furnissii]|uniref:hypothetical protein n=1 Tax=Vibrio furnissii TaxID=29494 RepID=UPI0005A4F059|nr:hypothetical protein [Vibrio furnissii]
MKIKLSRAKLIKWLKKVLGVTLLSISFGNDVSSVISNTTSPKFLAHVMEQRLDSFPKGHYLVEYVRSDEDEQDDIPYNKTIWVIAYNANVAGGGKILNLTNLLNDLANYEYIISSTKSSGAYNLTTVHAKQPQDPFELEELLITLNKHASFVSVQDGSGIVHGGNSFVNGKKFT